MKKTGLIIRVDAGALIVEAEGRKYRCTLRGRLKLEDTKLTNLVAVGDEVTFTPLEENEGVIEEVAERRSVLARLSMKKAEGIQVIAANVDQLVIVAAIRKPSLKVRFIDRMLIAAELGEMTPVLCITKLDLAGNMKYEKKLAQYKNLVKEIVFTSVVTGVGLDDLKNVLTDKVSVLAGRSGVGKTSLLNVLIPGSDFMIKEVSRTTGKGTHATTSVQLMPFPFGGHVVDTPGVKGFRVGLVEKEELGYYFAEMEQYLPECRFKNCTHRHEPSCAVKEAVEAGAIPVERYESYLRIYQTLEQKER